MALWKVFLFGLLGGLIPDLLRFIKYKYKKSFPAYLRYPTFWLGVLVCLALGLLTAWLFSATTPLQAIACGFSAPELLTKLLSKSTDDMDRSNNKFDLRTWWAG